MAKRLPMCARCSWWMPFLMYYTLRLPFVADAPSNCSTWSGNCCCCCCYHRALLYCMCAHRQWTTAIHEASTKNPKCIASHTVAQRSNTADILWSWEPTYNMCVYSMIFVRALLNLNMLHIRFLNWIACVHRVCFGIGPRRANSVQCAVHRAPAEENKMPKTRVKLLLISNRFFRCCLNKIRLMNKHGLDINI